MKINQDQATSMAQMQQNQVQMQQTQVQMQQTQAQMQQDHAAAMAQLQQNQANNIAAAAAAAAAALNPPPAPVDIDWMSRFRKNDPPRFEGGFNPDGAQKWLQEMEKILRSLQPPADQQVRLVEYVLMSEAEHWWEHQRRSLEAENEVITWDLFKVRFLDKYFPEDVRREK